MKTTNYSQFPISKIIRSVLVPVMVLAGLNLYCRGQYRQGENVPIVYPTLRVFIFFRKLIGPGVHESRRRDQILTEV